MTFELHRNYRTEKICRRCETVFVPSSNGPQIYCDPCRSQGRVVARFYVPEILSVDGRCGIEGCERFVYSKGYCGLHYQRVNTHGHAGSAEPVVKRPRGKRCSVEGCDKAARGAGLCITHYRRKQKFGDPGGAVLMRAKMGDGTITPDGYRKITVGGKLVYEHRAVMEVQLGRRLRKGEQIHHKDGDRLNNRSNNLELWSRYQPSGQRVSDKIDACKGYLREHGYEIPQFDVTSYLAGATACL